MCIFIYIFYIQIQPVNQIQAVNHLYVNARKGVTKELLLIFTSCKYVT